MKTKTVTVEFTYKVFEPGDKVCRSSSRSGLTVGIHVVKEFFPPLVPYVLDGTVTIVGHECGYSAEYIMLASEDGTDLLANISDETYSRLMDEVNDIRYLLVKSGKMATKTGVEDVLITRYLCTRDSAHELLNLNESANIRGFMIDSKGVHWRANRPEPKAEDWPELTSIPD